MISKGNYYEFLGVSASADADTIRSAFRRLSKDLHPDTTSLPSKEAIEEFRKLCEIYEFLADPEKRKAYDQDLFDASCSESKYANQTKSEPLSKSTRIGFHRPFSGGEIFSLLLLVFSLLFGLLLAVVVGLLKGQEWQPTPSWMLIDKTVANLIIDQPQNGFTPFSRDSIESAFPSGHRELAK